jgi:hypothetical protein
MIHRLLVAYDGFAFTRKHSLVRPPKPMQEYEGAKHISLFNQWIAKDLHAVSDDTNACTAAQYAVAG